MIVDEEGDASGASPSLDTWVSLNIYWGCTWESPSLSVWHTLIFFHHLPSRTWKLPSYITHCRLIREVSTLIKWFSSTENKDFQEELLFLLPAQKDLQQKSKLKKCKTAKWKTGAEAEKNRTAYKGELFRGTSATQIKKPWIDAWKLIVWSILSKKFRSKIWAGDLLRIFPSSRQNLFLDSRHQILNFHAIWG